MRFTRTAVSLSPFGRQLLIPSFVSKLVNRDQILIALFMMIKDLITNMIDQYNKYNKYNKHNKYNKYNKYNKQ